MRKWRRKLPEYKPKGKKYSVIDKLRKDGKSNAVFEGMVSLLTLEELIALKLETAVRSSGGFFYGVPLWRIVQVSAKKALLMFALTAARTKSEAAAFLSKDKDNFYKMVRKYNAENYFEQNSKENSLTGG